MMPEGDLLWYDMGAGVEAFSTLRTATLPYPVVQPHQTHTDTVALVDRPDLTRQDLEGVDALITNLEECAIGVRTADCIPVLLYDPVRRAAGAVHSGWRGTVRRISEKTVLSMHEQFGTDPADLIAVIGPGIGPDSFQVGQEVADEFASAGFDMSQIMSDRGPRTEGDMSGGLHIDLWNAVRMTLTGAGLSDERIHTAGICTYQNNSMFFSARREGNKCGRIINSIKIHGFCGKKG